MLGSLLGGRIGVLFAKPQIDRRLVIACLYRCCCAGSFSPLALRTLSAFHGNALRDDASKYSVKTKNTLSRCFIAEGSVFCFAAIRA